MRRLIFILLSALVLTSVAYAGTQASGDGAISILNANVTAIAISGKGTIYGQFDKGAISVTDTDLTDGTPIVTGYQHRTVNGATVTYTGRNITFQLVGGTYKLAISGTNVDFVAVGVGKAYLKGDPKAADPGTYTADGAKQRAIPVTPAAAPPAGTVWPGLLVAFGRQPAATAVQSGQ
jgi:hypothetical protein